MQLVSDKSVVLSGDLDFLAFSFARMRLQGRHLCTQAITGNMDEACKRGFLERYEFYVTRLREESLAE